MKKSVQMICAGVAAMDGCGATLTLVERRHYDGRCEHCALDWDERVRAWRFGCDDPDLDAHFEDGGGRRAAVPVQLRRATAA